MRSVLRGLRARGWALLSVMVTVATVAGFAALTADAWTVRMPKAALDDLRTAPAAGVVISWQSVDSGGSAEAARHVRAAVEEVAPPGTFDIEAVAVSAPYHLPTAAAADAGHHLASLVSTADVLPHAVLTAGAWPSAPGGDGVVPVAVPDGALPYLSVRVGGTIRLTDGTTGAVTVVRVTGTYQRSGDRPAAWLWDRVGPSGRLLDGPFTYLGPIAAPAAAFDDGAVATAGITWVLTPTATLFDASGLAAQATALENSAELRPAHGYSVTTSLPTVLAGLTARSVAGRSQLLAIAVLVCLLAGVALVAATGQLVALGAAQSALLYWRGARRRVLVGAYAPDALLLCGAAALGVVGQQALRGKGFDPAWSAWASGLAVAVVAVVILAVRSARPPSTAEVAGGAGRQDSATMFVRAGADVALAVLAAVALWQAGRIGLVSDTTTGRSGVVVIVAATPALATAAGAALAGRLVTGAALLGERAARRARRLPTRLAAWELARTPLRRLGPALICVATVTGCAYAAAEQASWRRSAHDQAAFSTGAEAAVTLAQPLDAGRMGAMADSPGVQATPVLESAQGDNTLIAVDAHHAGGVVALRPDQLGGSARSFWGQLAPDGPPPGIVVPGRPAALGVRVSLSAASASTSASNSTASGTAAKPVQARVVLTVQDATGLAFPLDLGPLSSDGVVRSLLGPLPGGDQPAFPLRIIGVAVSYDAPQNAGPHLALTVSQFTAQSASGGGSEAFGAAALASWQPAGRMVGAGDILCGGAALKALPPEYLGRSEDGAAVTFSTGSSGCDPAHRATLALTPDGPEPAIPAAATAAYLTTTGAVVGSVTQVYIDQTPIPVRIVESVAEFPGAVGSSAAGNGAVLLVDTTALATAATGRGAELPPVYSWWLHTGGRAALPRVAADGTVAEAADAQAALLADPLSAVPQRVLTVAIPVLVGLALLGLLVSLLASAREAAARDMVLGALGVTASQRAAMNVILQAAAVVPAAALGGGLGFALAAQVVPDFVLAPDASAPSPPATVLFAAPATLLAGSVVIAGALVGALVAARRRGDPLALARAGE